MTTPSICPNFDLREATKKHNDIAMFLTEKVISAVARNSNFVYSPTSISAVLTMVAACCEEETVRSTILSFFMASSTDELYAVFREVVSVVLPDGSAGGGPKIASVNGVWIDQSIYVHPTSKNLLLNFFKAEFAQVDFQSKAEEVRREVNAWGSYHTNGLIKDILPRGSVSSLTKWIFGNALYFKGDWQKKFNKSLTKNEPFHLLNGESVFVPFMSSNYHYQYITAYDGFKVLKLPYKQGLDNTHRALSMYFYLPDKNDGLDNLLVRMASTNGFSDNHIPSHEVSVGEFRIPKFKIEFGFNATKVFGGLDLNVPMYQKAFIEIDEEGTEAAAVTVTTGFGACSMPKRINFVADHPFIFLIRENRTGTILFAGQIFDPSKSSSA